MGERHTGPRGLGTRAALWDLEQWAGAPGRAWDPWAGNCEGVWLPPPGPAWPLRRGTLRGGWAHIQTPQWSSVCRPRRAGAQASGPSAHILLLRSQLPRRLGPGAGGRRGAPGPARGPPGDDGWGPALLGSPSSRWGRDGGTLKGQVLLSGCLREGWGLGVGPVVLGGERFSWGWAGWGFCSSEVRVTSVPPTPPTISITMTSPVGGGGASRHLGNRWGPGWRRSFPTTNGAGVGAGTGRVRRWGWGRSPQGPRPRCDFPFLPLSAPALASVSMATARPVMGYPSSALRCCMPTTRSAQ